MGWFKNIARKVVKSPFGRAMDTAVAAFAQPVSTFKAITTKATFKQQTKSFWEKPLSTQISKIAVSGAMYIGAVLGGSAIATTGVGAAARVMIPKTLKGKAIAFVAAPAVAAVVIKQPTIIEKVSELPATAFQAGSVAADPSVKGVTEFIKEHPLVSTAAVVVGGYGAAKGVTAITGLIKEAKTDNVLKQTSKGVFEATPEQAQQLIKEKPVGIVGQPQTPQTTKITTTRRKYKRRTAKKTPSVRQSVKINIVNRPVGLKNINYIRERLYN